MTAPLSGQCVQDIFPTPCDPTVVSPPVPVTDPPVFPLDPLTPTELCWAVTIAQYYLETIYPNTDPRLIFDRVELKLPPKEEVLAFQPGDPLQRIAFVTVYSPKVDKYHTMEINLTQNFVAKFDSIKHGRPSWTNTDNSNVYNLLNSDPQIIAALAKRGITVEQINNGNIQWCVAVDGRLNNLECSSENDVDSCKAKKNNGCGQCNNIQPKDINKHTRLYYASPWWIDGNANTDPTVPVDNYYTMPIAGIFAWVDENAEPCGKVLKVIDTNDLALAPWGLSKFNCPPNAFFTEFAGTLTPLNVCQPEGPSFTINGNEITWEKWKLRFSMHPTYGLVLNLVQFNEIYSGDQPDNYRSILYQANLAEALTLYGTTDDFTRVHNFLDLGEYQSRLYVTSLQRGVDVPPYATLYSPVFVDETGELLQYTNALAIYEQDGGVLWRHYDSVNGIFQGRRARQLVLTHTNTVGNYDYAFYWTFNQDGVIDISVRLTGIDEFLAVNQKTVPPEIPFAELCHENIAGPNHQHAFNYRLDFDLDGTKNSVFEVNTKAVKPGKDNPCSNGWFVEEKLLKNSHEARRKIKASSSRRWVFKNPDSINSLGQVRGYAIEPTVSAKSYDGKCARINKRAHLLNHNFFATKYDGHLFSPMGQYPVERPEDHGLAKAIHERQPLVDEDVVGWYTMIFAHHPEAGNYPVLPFEEVGFSITPDNFFIQNPAMDVDPDMFGCCDDCDPTTCAIDPSCP